MAYPVRSGIAPGQTGWLRITTGQGRPRLSSFPVIAREEPLPVVSAITLTQTAMHCLSRQDKTSTLTQTRKCCLLLFRRRPDNSAQRVERPKGGSATEMPGALAGKKRCHSGAGRNPARNALNALWGDCNRNARALAGMKRCHSGAGRNPARSALNALWGDCNRNARALAGMKRCHSGAGRNPARSALKVWREKHNGQARALAWR